MSLFAQNQKDLKSQLKSALELEAPYEKERYPASVIEGLPKNPHLAAVLILFGRGATNEVQILYTKRTEHLDHHKGQIAFPGGFCEPEDGGDPAITALREAEEEVGVERRWVEVVGQLPSYPTTTGFLIQPIVGILNTPIEKIELKLNDFEIAHVFWVSLDVLLDSNTYRLESYPYKEFTVPIHVYQVEDYRIWGATGTITKNLLDRLIKLR